MDLHMLDHLFLEKPFDLKLLPLKGGIPSVTREVSLFLLNMESRGYFYLQTAVRRALIFLSSSEIVCKPSKDKTCEFFFLFRGKTCSD